MKAMVALVRREYLEHRGAFLYAPGVILALLGMILFGSILTKRVHMSFEVDLPSAQKFFEFGFLSVSGLWFVYLLAALFFYFADAFNADRRNNSMLFWKSMPVSDFTVLFAKLAAGLTLFPALVYLASLLTGVLVLIAAAAATLTHPGLILPGPLAFLGSAWSIASFTLVYLVLALLWYAPFLAWVGALSTLVGRWSIPLAFLIPGFLGLAEQMFTGSTNPGIVLSFLRQRIRFFAPGDVENVLQAEVHAGGRLLAGLLASIDWTQLAAGLIFAALAVYAASEYRRRVIST